MTLAELGTFLREFGLPTLLVIVLIVAIGYALRVLWLHFIKQSEADRATILEQVKHARELAERERELAERERTDARRDRESYHVMLKVEHDNFIAALHKIGSSFDAGIAALNVKEIKHG